MLTLSRILSAIFTPLMIPTYAMLLAWWLSVYYFLPTKTLFGVVFVAWVITFVVPFVAILLLYRFKWISDIALNKREERWLPCLIASLCLLCCSLYLSSAHAPEWMSMFMIGGGVAALLSCIVGFRWKISVHATSLAGMVAMMFRMMHDQIAIWNMWPIVSVAIILLGAVCSARILLGKHTFAQVFAGAVNGFVCVYLITII
ncbi:MAG: hypothetical protein IJY30_05735 [Muribaculaceae bacterium]|nr:hypothetical protein [Muribaculaceae bacterium]